MNCDCHLKLKQCKSPIYTTRRGGLFRNPSEWIRCGKMIKKLEQCRKLKLHEKQ